MGTFLQDDIHFFRRKAVSGQRLVHQSVRVKPVKSRLKFENAGSGCRAVQLREPKHSKSFPATSLLRDAS